MQDQIDKLEKEVENLQELMRDIFTVLLPLYGHDFSDLNCKWRPLFLKPWAWVLPPKKETESIKEEIQKDIEDE